MFVVFPLSQAEDLREMAKACQDDGCSVEAVSNLLDQLKSKKKELEVRVIFGFACATFRDLGFRDLGNGLSRVHLLLQARFCVEESAVRGFDHESR